LAIARNRNRRKNMTPTVGRIVHYTNLGDKEGKYPPEIQAALVTKVVTRNAVQLTSPTEADYIVSLRIFYEMGDFAMIDVPFTTEPAGTDEARGHWAWPAR
jgi:hypothetical protein